MSRMSSWNRPLKHSAIPPPYYITAGDDVPYCQSCGRVMNTRKATKINSTKSNSATKPIIKYCSDRCRRLKPGSLDREIEQTFLSLLTGTRSAAAFSEGVSLKQPQQRRTKKGDSRILVKVDEVEELMFGKRPESEKTRVGKRIRKETKEWRSVDMESSESEEHTASDNDENDGDDDGAQILSVHVGDQDMVELRRKKVGSRKVHDGDLEGLRRNDDPQNTNDDIISTTVAETPEIVQKRAKGQKCAEYKEMVRKAARRAVAFGVLVDTDQPSHDTEALERRKCEAVVNGLVVEPSFAKGNWGIRWRE